MPKNIYEYSGAGWYGEVYLQPSGHWAWAVAVDMVDRLLCQQCIGFYEPAAAERSMKAFVKINQENDLDRWLRFAGSIPVK